MDAPLESGRHRQPDHKHERNVLPYNAITLFMAFISWRMATSTTRHYSCIGVASLHSGGGGGDGGTMAEELEFIARCGVPKSHSHVKLHTIQSGHHRQYTHWHSDRIAPRCHIEPCHTADPSAPQKWYEVGVNDWWLNGGMQLRQQPVWTSKVRSTTARGILRKKQKKKWEANRKGLVVSGHFHALFCGFKYAFHTLKTLRANGVLCFSFMGWILLFHVIDIDIITNALLMRAYFIIRIIKDSEHNVFFLVTSFFFACW